MRKPFIAGNWKMNKTIADTRHLVSELVPELQAISGVEKAICPPFTALLAASALLEGTDIQLGAQNLHWEPSGAFTGEISPLMLAELCHYVIIGHSERRTYFGETDEMVNLKVRAALQHGLIPIVCVGETLLENESGRTAEVVTRQMRNCLVGVDLKGLGAFANMVEPPLVIAYEPVWAIGTGRAATADGANVVIANYIRSILADKFGEDTAQNVRILYGGSVKGDNAAEFFKMPDIDGALVGGASLKTSDFTSITRAAQVRLA
jgi:triosephosphate isomerase